MTPFGITIDAQGFAQTLAKNKIRRGLKSVITGINSEDLKWLIANDRNIIDFIPKEKLTGLKQGASQYQGVVEKLDTNEVYDWLGEPTRVFLESFPKGRDWAIRQFELIKKALNE